MTAAPARGARATPAREGRPRFFATAAAFREWLARHHASEKVLVVGFHRVATGKRSITYPQALDEALCFGWIDGLRRGIDGASYSIRFTPRRRDSIWSAVNLGHIARLDREGRLAPAGRAVFEARDPNKTERYSDAIRRHRLAPVFAKRLAGDARANAHAASLPPSHRRAVVHWIMSAKQEVTRERRFATLLDCARRGVPVTPLALPKVVADRPVRPRRPVRARRATDRAEPTSRKA